MKSVLLVSMIALSTSAIAGTKVPKSRSIFDLGKEKGSISKMQVDLDQRSGKWFARVKTLLANGKTAEGELSCTAGASDEYDCRRDDDGGRFLISLKPNPKFTTTYFSISEEGDTEDISIRSKDGQPLVIEGTKGVLSPRDAF